MNQVVIENPAPCIRGDKQESLSLKGLNFTRNDFRRVLFGTLGLLGSAACTVQFEPSDRYISGDAIIDRDFDTKRDSGIPEYDAGDTNPLPQDSEEADVSAVDSGLFDIGLADAAMPDSGEISDAHADASDVAIVDAAPDTGGPMVDVGEGEGQIAEGEGEGEGGEGEGPLPCPPDLCTVGQGICERVGAVVCDEDGQAIGCDAIPGQPRNREICNSADDNCDGQTDESFPEGDEFCIVGRGACRAEGPRICVDGEVQCGVQAGNPTEERCNTIDDDCDGQTDESFPEEGQECQVGIGACQEVGSVVCDRGELQCNAVPGEPQQEICNQLDDNCDGLVNETFPEQDDVCAVGTGECLREGNKICAGGEIQCNAAPGEPEPEECDGLDNNCDGQIDIDPQTGEPLTQVCEDCGVQECQGDGNFGDCGPDTDADGVIDCKDNCPQVQNPDQQDANQNGIGDDCDAAMGNRACTNLAANPSPDIQTVGGNARVYLDRCGSVWLQPRRDGGSPEKFYTHVPANPGLDPAGAHANVSVNRIQGAALGGCVGTTDLNTAESIRARGNCFEVSMGP